MTAPHNLDDAHGSAEPSSKLRRDTRLQIALVLNVTVVVAQVTYGVLAGSLGLLADAGHNITDVGALALSLFAIKVARRRPTAQRSFGWHRGTVLAAQANAVTILIATAWIAYEGIARLADPQSVEGGTVVVVASIAFAANAVAAIFLHERHAHSASTDLNMRSAMLHLLSDALASLGVAIAGAIMFATGGWNWLDPAVSLAIAASIAWHAVRLLRAANAVLLEGSPDHIDLELLERSIATTDGIEAVHDLHVWSISSEMLALSAHIVIEGHPTLEEAQLVAQRVKARLAHDYAIAHATLELECETCEDLGPACDIDRFEPGAAHGHSHLHSHSPHIGG